MLKFTVVKKPLCPVTACYDYYIVNTAKCIVKFWCSRTFFTIPPTVHAILTVLTVIKKPFL